MKINLLLIWGIQVGDISILGWPIGLIKLVIWTDSLYFLYVLFQVLTDKCAVIEIIPSCGMQHSRSLSPEDGYIQLQKHSILWFMEYRRMDKAKNLVILIICQQPK
jgi:hypothetical protein